MPRTPPMGMPALSTPIAKARSAGSSRPPSTSKRARTPLGQIPTAARQNEQLREAANQPAERSERAEECGARGDDRLAILEVAEHAEQQGWTPRRPGCMPPSRPSCVSLSTSSRLIDSNSAEDDVAIEIVAEVDERQQCQRRAGAHPELARGRHPAQKPTVEVPMRSGLRAWCAPPSSGCRFQ